MSAQKNFRVEKINYKGWENCYRLTNSVVDLIVTTDVGPRIIRFGFVGEENEFKEYYGQMRKTGGNEWRIYGGHRLWLAPEDKALTYVPDNEAVKFEPHEKFARVIQPADKLTGIQKEMDISLFHEKSAAKIVHRLVNANKFETIVAPWALSVMKPGGIGILPLPPRGTHEENLLPSGTLALWTYTDLSDARFYTGENYVLLRQDKKAATPQKIGTMPREEWMAYVRRNGNLCVKTFKHIQGTAYPDFGCSAEMYTNEMMLELETLGPLVTLKMNESVEHAERWFLFRDVPAPKNDADVDKNVLPKIHAHVCCDA